MKTTTGCWHCSCTPLNAIFKLNCNKKKIKLLLKINRQINTKNGNGEFWARENRVDPTKSPGKERVCNCLIQFSAPLKMEKKLAPGLGLLLPLSPHGYTPAHNSVITQKTIQQDMNKANSVQKPFYKNLQPLVL